MEPLSLDGIEVFHQRQHLTLVDQYSGLFKHGAKIVMIQQIKGFSNLGVKDYFYANIFYGTTEPTDRIQRCN